MGLVYSAMLAAAQETPALGYIISPINMGISAYNTLMHYPHKLWASEPIQGGLADAFMIYDFYLKYCFPYIIVGAVALSYMGLPKFSRSKEMMAFQTRGQLEAMIQQDPNNQMRWAERWGLV